MRLDSQMKARLLLLLLLRQQLQVVQGQEAEARAVMRACPLAPLGMLMLQQLFLAILRWIPSVSCLAW